MASTYQTTYTTTYRPTEVLPPIKYSQPPCFDLRHFPQLQPRQFPVIPTGPHRPLVQQTPLCPGLGTRHLNTERLLDPKPIVRTKPPQKLPRVRQDTHIPSIRPSDPNTRSLVDAICDDVIWTSTTRLATEEGKLRTGKDVCAPCSSFEENSDLVKYRPQRYEPEAETWQRVAQHWERVQTRPVTDRADTSSQSTAKPRPCSGRLLAKRKRMTKDKEGGDEGKPKGLSASLHERPCPGYAGFKPRYPLVAPPERPLKETPYVSVMQLSYRKFPECTSRIQQFAHQGPMSKTVTLTFPYNPFNKVEKRK